MIVKEYETREEWLADRSGKITGSRLKDIVVKRGLGKKIGFYRLIAERIAEDADDENPMDRGTRLEEEAVAMFVEKTGKEVDTSLVMWMREDDNSIAISPDGFIDREQAVEAKCLSSAAHIEAYLTQQIPSEYEYQALQYFIVNDDLIKLYFCFYDPRIPAIPFFYLEIDRESKASEIAEYLEYERQVLEEVNEIVTKLTF